jgi:hypothetical protein
MNGKNVNMYDASYIDTDSGRKIRMLCKRTELLTGYLNEAVLSYLP